MINPYIILNVRQDADKREIIKAQMHAMKERNYSLQVIHKAVRQLLSPAKRLAADFMFPVKIKSKRIHKIPIDTPYQIDKLYQIDEDTFDSLKSNVHE